MKRSPVLVSCALLLAGCSTTPSDTVGSLLDNPLFAEQYAEEIVDFMVNLEIYEHEASKDEDKKAIIDSQREEWLEVARKARTIQRKGGENTFVGVASDVAGRVLYVDNMLYLSPDFITSPTAGLHIYLTTGVDPRDGFPEDDTIDLGKILTPYGAQSYTVPEVENPLLYRTVVLYDPELDIIFAFAQLNFVVN